MSQKDGSIYGCFKAAIIHFTKSAASELSKYNIRVNCITPGVIKTSMTSNYIKNKKENTRANHLNSLGKGQDIANGEFFCLQMMQLILVEKICLSLVVNILYRIKHGKI